MTYAPNEADAWVPDIAGNAAAWTKLIENNTFLYRELGSVPVSAYGSFISPSNGSAGVVCRFAVPGNFDELDVRLYFNYSQTGATADVSITLTDGTLEDTATVTLTDPGSGLTYVAVTPSNTSASATPRYIYVTLRAANTETITLGYIQCVVIPAAPAAGVLDSGFESVAASWYTGSAPVPSGITHVLTNNPYKIAKDRLNAIVSLVQQEEDARVGHFSTASTASKTVLRIPMAQSLGDFSVFRKCRVWLYVEQYLSAKADVNIFIGGQIIQFLDQVGILTSTFYINGSDFSSTPQISVMMRVSSGGGSVAIRTFQILEEK